MISERGVQHCWHKITLFKGKHWREKSNKIFGSMTLLVHTSFLPHMAKFHKESYRDA